MTGIGLIWYVCIDQLFSLTGKPPPQSSLDLFAINGSPLRSRPLLIGRSPVGEEVVQLPFRELFGFLIIFIEIIKYFQLGFGKLQ